MRKSHKILQFLLFFRKIRLFWHFYSIFSIMLGNLTHPLGNLITSLSKMGLFEFWLLVFLLWWRKTEVYFQCKIKLYLLIMKTHSSRNSSWKLNHMISDLQTWQSFFDLYALEWEISHFSPTYPNHISLWGDNSFDHPV